MATFKDIRLLTELLAPHLSRVEMFPDYAKPAHVPACDCDVFEPIERNVHMSMTLCKNCNRWMSDLRRLEPRGSHGSHN